MTRSLQSCLAGRVIHPPTDPAYVRGLAFDAWHKQGKVMIDPGDIKDPFERQIIVGVAERLYGKRGI
jgi:hypothetical protein